MENNHLSFIARQSTDLKSVSLGPNKVTFLISGEETGGKFSLTKFESAPPPAPAAPLHIHHDADETIYVLEGEFQIIYKEQEIAMQQGASIFVPKGNPHTIANIGTTPGTILVFLSPPGFEGYWNEMSHLMQSSNGPVAPEVALAAQHKYHVDMLGHARKYTVE